MSLDEILVIAGGLAAIAWVNWYFLVVGRRGTGSREAGPGNGAPGTGRGEGV